MSNVKTVHVPHLGGIDAAYQMPNGYDPSKPTLVMVNSFTTNSYLYRRQFANEELNKAMNLIAIDLLGHGETRTKSETFTYWDTAIMNLQVLAALSITSAFVLGTSQGGWICVRMALLAPSTIQGIIPLGTSMDHESPRTRDNGCWNGPANLAPSIQSWTVLDTTTPDFAPGLEYSNFLIDSGLGSDCAAEEREFWNEMIQESYRGDEGRKRIRMAAINLTERDGLLGRLSDVRCPVLWMHGTSDAVYSAKNAEEEIVLFTGSKDARLQIVEGGQHFLSASHPDVVDKAVIEFVGKWSAKGNAHL